MAVEVELKAWVDDPDSLRLKLEAICIFRNDFRKEDIYFLSPVDNDGRRRQFRVRREHGISTVTFKDKSRDEGMEVNAEHEFTVSDHDMLLSFFSFLGASEHVRKEKTGSAYAYGDLTVELCLVKNLGWFVEIEKLIPEPSEEAVKKAQGEIRDFFSRTGIDDRRIEQRYYTEMLLEQENC